MQTQDTRYDDWALYPPSFW